MKRITYSTLSIITTLLIVGGFYFANSAQSQNISSTPPESPKVVQSPTNTLFSYQGQLLDAGGTPINNAAMPMTFKLYGILSGGTACWTENQTVAMENGRFHVNIGAITPIPDNCLQNDAFLELVINGETLTPRELFTSVATAVNSQNLPDGAQIGSAIVGQDLVFDSSFGKGSIFGTDNEALVLGGDHTPFRDTWYRGAWLWLNSLDNVSNPGSARIHIVKDNTLNNAPFFDIYKVQDVGGSQSLMHLSEMGHLTTSGGMTVNGNVEIGGDITSVSDINEVSNIRGKFGQQLHMPSNGNTYINWHNGGGLAYGGGTQTAKFSVDTNGNGSFAGNLTCGGYIEINLQTPEEQAATQIERFKEGDLMCWDAKSDRLELCTQPNDHLVMAVADPNGKPIIMGAEFINVIGLVHAGDILVTSDVPGYAMVNNSPAPGTVIGQALEDFDDESGLIKAMIRKW